MRPAGPAALRSFSLDNTLKGRDMPHVVSGARTVGAPSLSIVLVHGAFVDGSGWQPVHGELAGFGFEVLVAPRLLGRQRRTAMRCCPSCRWRARASNISPARGTRPASIPPHGCTISSSSTARAPRKSSWTSSTTHAPTSRSIPPFSPIPARISRRR